MAVIQKTQGNVIKNSNIDQPITNQRKTFCCNNCCILIYPSMTRNQERNPEPGFSNSQARNRTPRADRPGPEKPGPLPNPGVNNG